jgi:hypothetical protein
MKGLIFNLLANAAGRAGCEGEAWEIALSLGLADGDFPDYVSEAEDDDAADAGASVTELLPLPGMRGTCFESLVRSACPFRDEDWTDLPGDPVPLGGARPRNAQAAPLVEPLRPSAIPPPRRR